MKKLLLTAFIFSFSLIAFSQDTCSLTISWDTVGRTPCGDMPGGYIEIEVSGGTTPYSFDWDGPNLYENHEQNAYNLYQGYYDVTVTDASGCEYKSSGYIVIDSDPIGLSIDPGNYGAYQISCPGATDGSLTVQDMRGGNGDFNEWPYHWTGPNGFESDSMNIKNLAAGEYRLETYDTIGCYHTEIIELKEPPPM